MAEKTLNIENAHIMFKNFSGKGSQFNREGDRNFCVRIDDADLARGLRNEGWNVKQLRPRDEDEEGTYYLQVKVSFKVSPPRVYMIAGKKKTLLDEEAINSLDYAEIQSADVIITPYNWEINGKKGVKAYLKIAYITIEQDAFAAKYAEEEGPEEDIPF